MVTMHERFTEPQQPWTRVVRRFEDRILTMTSEEAYNCLCTFLAYERTVRRWNFEGSTATVVLEERLRSGAVFELTFTGNLEKMLDCLVAVYYWYEGCCEAGRIFGLLEKDQTRENFAATMTERERLGAFLRQSGYEPIRVEGLFDIRHPSTTMCVGIMLHAGITDLESLDIGVGLRPQVLLEACLFVRVLGISFRDALVHARA